MSPMMTFLLILLAVNTAALVVVTVLYRKAKKASRPRRIEAPNSQYKSRYVMDLEAKDRWGKVDLDRLHPVNREEFEKILAKVHATSVRALSSYERSFLDRMADAHDRVGGEDDGRGGGGGRGRSSAGPRHATGAP